MFNATDQQPRQIMQALAVRNSADLIVGRNETCKLNASIVSNQLRSRVKQFAVRVVKYVQQLSRSVPGQEIGRQLLRSGTGVSADGLSNEEVQRLFEAELLFADPAVRRK